MDNLESILSSVMNNEDLINKIKDTVKKQNHDSSSLNEVISLITPIFNQTNENSTASSTESKDTNSTKNTEYKNNTFSFVNSISHSVSKNSGLLLALKPYLREERCKIIDSVIKISQITDALNLI